MDHFQGNVREFYLQTTTVGIFNKDIIMEEEEEENRDSPEAINTILSLEQHKKQRITILPLDPFPFQHCGRVPVPFHFPVTF